MKTRRTISQKHLALIVALLGIALLSPVQSHAYAGPGAGFAVLSSFWTLFVAFLYSIYAFFVWPFRQLFRVLRKRKAYGKAHIKRAVIPFLPERLRLVPAARAA